MTRTQWTFLLLLTYLLVLAANVHAENNQIKVLRELKVVDASSANVRQCLWFAMQEYNKDSEDEYLFQVTKVVQAQLQVTDHLDYSIDVEIARSNCIKSSTNNESCGIQENFHLEKRAACNFLVSALPWNGEFTVVKKQCVEI
ncbi:cystatin-8 [Sorex fumeus]|uniref:cystatin-8 n=1 Tax=Sorex fumeus TaxID=62283 RepID=UPI0024AE3E05|nr:cystatin-8 [Sorex fumeus]